MPIVELALLLCAGASPAVPTLPSSWKTPAATTSRLNWLDHYGAAYKKAEESANWLLVWFQDASTNDDRESLDIWHDPEIVQRMERYVPVRVTTATQINDEGKQIVLSSHTAYAELHARAGIAIVDLTQSSSPHFGNVVSIYPFEGKAIPRSDLLALLSLPPGSLTQRTLIFAVRTHPDSPRSASGEFLQLLADEAQGHSAYQAAWMEQGHHRLDERFHRLNEQLPSRLIAQEVCAESWPGQSLMAAARGCVHSWRQSPGHWSAVYEAHPAFGFDMKRGRNGIWYATGVFGRTR